MELQRLRDQEHFELIRELENAVIYKHGPMCWAGMVAHRHLKRFATRHPDIPVFFLDSVAQRSLARHIAGVFGIRHESPQAIFLVDGEPVWNDSHYRLTSSALERVAEDRRKLASDSIPGDRG